MSKFWGGDDASSSNSDSNSDSDSDSSNSSSSSNSSNEDTKKKKGDTAGNRWVMDSDSDSDDDDDRKKVISSLDKDVLKIGELALQLKTAIASNGWASIQSVFGEWTAFEEKKKVFNTMQTTGKWTIPRVMVKTLCNIEDCLNANLKDKSQFKKMSATDGRSLNRMKLQFRKYVKVHEIVMKGYRESPDVEEEEAVSCSSYPTNITVLRNTYNTCPTILYLLAHVN